MSELQNQNSTGIKKKILLIEDNIDTQLIYKVYLRNLYEIEIADTAEKGIELLYNNKYDLLILDIHLPGKLDGNDILNQMKNQNKSKVCPILVVTAYAMNEDKEKFISLGADGYLSKPVLKDDFLNEVHTFTTLN